MKTSAGWFSLSTGREGEDEDYVEGTTLVSSLSDERVGSGGDDINSTNLTSFSKGRVGSTKDGLGLTASTSLFNERVGSTKDRIGSTT